jgi:polyferredoxin
MTSATKKDHAESRRTLSSIRQGMQYIFLAGTFLIGLRHIMPGESSRGGAFDSFCPFGGVEILWAYMTTGQTLKTTNLLNFAVLISVLGLSLLVGRAFCGWMCPIGTLQDMLTRGTRRLSGGKKNPRRGLKSKTRYLLQVPPKIDRWLRYLKYLVLFGILIASTMMIYPPLWDFCPARALFSFHLTTPLLWSILIIFVITSMLVQRFWCKYLCPLGALLAVSNKFAPLRIVINQEGCTSCHRCEADCPVDIAPIPENMRSLECVQCLECLETCAVSDTLELKLG